MDSWERLPAAIASNVLDRRFEAPAPNRKWIFDFTYIWTAEGWLYLAVILDLYSRRVVGWATSDRLKRDLALDALRMALARRNPPAGLVHHSDRGSQYCSHDYQKLLTLHGLVCSMSKRGDCYDNAAMESWNHSFKVEAIHGEKFATRAVAKNHVFPRIQGLIRLYIRRGLDAENVGYSLAKDSRFIEKLKRQGVPDEVIFEAISGASEKFAEQAAKMPLNFGQSLTILNNNWSVFVNGLMNSTGIMSGVASVVKLVADNLNYIVPVVAGLAAAVLATVAPTLAATAAAFPWIFCALYFVFVFNESWKEALLIGESGLTANTM